MSFRPGLVFRGHWFKTLMMLTLESLPIFGLCVKRYITDLFYVIHVDYYGSLSKGRRRKRKAIRRGMRRRGNRKGKSEIGVEVERELEREKKGTKKSKNYSRVDEKRGKRQR